MKICFVLRILSGFLFPSAGFLFLELAHIFSGIYDQFNLVPSLLLNLLLFFFVSFGWFWTDFFLFWQF